VANDSDTCESLKEDLKSDQDELNALIRRAPFVTDPDERRLLAEEMSRLRQEIRELQHAISIACRPPPPPPNVSITGVEQTQATQFFKSLLSPCPDRPGQAPCVDNDIPLVAGKATVFRVYTNVLAHPTVPITALTGVLEARPAGSTGLPVGLTPYNGPQPPRLQSQISRKNLNYRLPAAMCHGQVEARLNVYDALHPGESGYTSQSFLRTLSFVETATLKIRLVRIHYKNAARAMDIPAPTTADFWTTAQYTLKTYPIPGIDVVRDTVELYDGDFTSFFASAGPGAQGTTGTIFDILTNLRNAESFPGDVHYLAIIPGFPANHTGASGWAISRRQIVEVLNGPAMAQEIGHDSGFPHHAPGCGAGDPDPNYPVYDSYPSASIGEFGFDVIDSVVFDPAVTEDFMSYCPNPWVSPYVYLGLLNTFQSAARLAGNSAPRNQDLLTAAFSVSSNGKVSSFQPGFPGAAPASPANGEATPYAIELHDKNGNPLVRERLRLTTPYQSLDDAQLDFSVAVPWRPEGRSLVIKRDDQVMSTHPIGSSAPTVDKAFTEWARAFGADFGKLGGERRGSREVALRSPVQQRQRPNVVRLGSEPDEDQAHGRPRSTPRWRPLRVAGVVRRGHASRRGDVGTVPRPVETEHRRDPHTTQRRRLRTGTTRSAVWVHPFLGGFQRSRRPELVVEHRRISGFWRPSCRSRSDAGTARHYAVERRWPRRRDLDLDLRQGAPALDTGVNRPDPPKRTSTTS